MPFYHRSGQIPAKRHTQFRKPNGELYSEELVSTEGFSSIYSLVYHCHPPTLVKAMGKPYSVEPKVAVEKNMQHRSFLTFKTKPESDYIKSRKVLLMNSDVQMGSAAPTQGFSDYFYKNSDADEVLFIHEGTGVLKPFMEISFLSMAIIWLFLGVQFINCILTMKTTAYSLSNRLHPFIHPIDI